MLRSSLLHVGLFAAIAALAWPTSALAADEETPSEPTGLAAALRDGTFGVALRYRFEYVDEESFDDTAEASTLRTSLTYRSAAYHGWSVFLEAEDVTAIPDDDGYRNAGAGSLDNGVRGVPVVADPELTELGQAYLRFVGGGFQATVGRQEINLGDQRWVGAVAWRQHHQSFDAARLGYSQGRVSVDYAYLDRVHRIFGDGRDVEGHLLWVPVTVVEGEGFGLKATALGLWLDFDEAPVLSTATLGLELGADWVPSAGWKGGAKLKVARQEDHGSNPASYDTDYAWVSVGVDRKGSASSWGVELAWERLGAAEPGGRSFQTPLATLHKWNGFADRFLSTPGVGLDTIYLFLRGKAGERWRWAVTYLDFSSDEGSLDFGREVDATLLFQSPWKQSFGFKAAIFDADEGGLRDVEKLMLTTSYRF